MPWCSSISILGTYGVTVCRTYVGSLLTSLDMGGVQVCLLRTTNNREWLKYLDDETDAFAWPGRVLSFEQSQIEITDKINFTKEVIIISITHLTVVTQN